MRTSEIISVRGSAKRRGSMTTFKFHSNVNSADVNMTSTCTFVFSMAYFMFLPSIAGIICNSGFLTTTIGITITQIHECLNECHIRHSSRWIPHAAYRQQWQHSQILAPLYSHMWVCNHHRFDTPTDKHYANCNERKCCLNWKMVLSTALQWLLAFFFRSLCTRFFLYPGFFMTLFFF